jgi:hypothetical protein
MEEFTFRFFIKDNKVIWSSIKEGDDDTLNNSGPAYDKYIDQVSTQRDVALWEYEFASGNLVKADYLTVFNANQPS